MKTLLLILLTLPVFAQVKIGIIEIPSEVAKEYFLDCHNRPDTLLPRTSWDYRAGIHERRPISRDWVSKRPSESEITAYRKEQNKLDSARWAELIARVGKENVITNWTIHDEMVDTISFSRTQFDEQASEYNRWIVEAAVAHLYNKYGNVEAYLIPRKPSEIDFIKWSIRKNN